MKRVWAVAKKEFWSYFNSMIAYAFALIFLTAVNFVYIWMILLPSAQVRLNYYFEVMIWGIWFIIPAITMRSWAEEKRLRTDELLLTLPVKDWEVVLGKFLAGWGFFGLILILSLGVPLGASLLGSPDWSVVLCGYIGIFLVAGGFIAVGMTMSSLTKSQFIAFILSLVVCLFLLALKELFAQLPGFAGLGFIINYLDIGEHFDSIARGVVDSRDLIYYLSVIFFFLVLNKYQLERRKWA